MLEWIATFFGWLTKGGDSARQDFAALTHAYNELMHNYQQQNQELLQRIDLLADEVASLRVGLEAEKEAHKECRRKLREHAAQIDRQQAQIASLNARVEALTNKVDGDG